jgi:membrane-associated phospholipid phosphatase
MTRRKGGTCARMLDAAAAAVDVCAQGGWIWVVPAAAAWLVGAPRAGRALATLAPSVAAAGWTADYPLSRYFEPRTGLNPSGHTATAAAAAWAAARIWPALGPPLLGVAAAVGLLRVYAHEHTLRDVLAGALVGLATAEAARAAASRVSVAG